MTTTKTPKIKETIKAGQRWHRAGEVLNADSTTLADLSSMKGIMEFRSQESGRLLVSITHNNGIILSDGSGTYNYELDLSSAQSMVFNGHEMILADFFIINGDIAYPVFNLQLRIELTQTQWQPLAGAPTIPSPDLQFLSLSTVIPIATLDVLGGITRQQVELLIPTSPTLNDLGGVTQQQVEELIPPPEQHTNRVAFVGTSLVQQCDSGSTASIAYSSKGWFRWMQMLTGHICDSPVWSDRRVIVGWEPSSIPNKSRGFYGFNFGVSGQNIAQILARKERVLSDCQTAGVKFIIVDGGTNDMGSKTKEYIQTSREELCNYFISGGLTVILLPILTRAVTSWPIGGTARVNAAWINQRTREYVKTKLNCFIFDWNEHWIDYSNVNGEPHTGYSNDGTHFDVKGAYSIGKGLADMMMSILPAPDLNNFSPDNIFSANNQFGNIAPNGYQYGANGRKYDAMTGVVSDEWAGQIYRGAMTVVASKEVAKYGEAQIYSITPSSAPATLLHRTYPSDRNHNGDLAGKWVVMEATVELSAYAGWQDIHCLIDDVSAANGLKTSSLSNTEGTFPNEAMILTMKTPPLLLEPDSIKLRMRVNIGINGIAGNPVVKISAIKCYQVDDPRVVYGIGN